MFDQDPARHEPNAQVFLPTPAPWPEQRAPQDTLQSRLLAAAGAGDLDAIRLALSVPAVRLDLGHPLRLAAKHRHRDAVGLLIEHGANISRAFSANHTPWRPGKRARLIEFLASCGIDAGFLAAEPRPRGPRRKRASLTGGGDRKSDPVRARQAAARRQAWAMRRDALRLRRVLRKHADLLEEIAAGASTNAGLERAVRAMLVERGIRDPKRRLAKVLVRQIGIERQASPPAA
jgi:hypothetical protein